MYYTFLRANSKAAYGSAFMCSCLHATKSWFPTTRPIIMIYEFGTDIDENCSKFGYGMT